MVTLQTAGFDAPMVDAGVLAPMAAGLGLSVDRDILGNPVAAWQ